MYMIQTTPTFSTPPLSTPPLTTTPFPPFPSHTHPSLTHNPYLPFRRDGTLTIRSPAITITPLSHPLIPLSHPFPSLTPLTHTHPLSHPSLSGETVPLQYAALQSRSWVQSQGTYPSLFDVKVLGKLRDERLPLLQVALTHYTH